MSAAAHRHHVDGRFGPEVPYIDDALVIPLVPADHRRLHLVLDDLDAAWPVAGEPLIVHRVRRHAITAGWAADHGRPVSFDPAAARSLQHLWLEVLDAIGGGAR